MTTNRIRVNLFQTIRQAAPARLASGSGHRILTALLGLLAVGLSLAGEQAQAAGSLSKSPSAQLQPGDIVYVDSGNAIDGGFVIKVDGATGRKSVISSGGLLQLPFGVVIDANGQLEVSDSGRLIGINPDTGAQRLIADNSRGTLGRPCGLAIDRSQSLLTANLSAVVRVGLNSGRIQMVCSGGRMLYPLDVAVAANGDLIVLDIAYPPEIIRLSPGCAQTVIASGGLLKAPQAIAVQGDHIYVTDVATSDGNFGIGRVIDVNAVTGGQTVAAEGQYLVGPVGIAVDAQGQLVVGDPYTINLKSPDLYDGGIIRINPVTHEQTLIARGEGAFVNPRGLAIVPGLSN